MPAIVEQRIENGGIYIRDRERIVVVSTADVQATFLALETVAIGGGEALQQEMARSQLIHRIASALALDDRQVVIDIDWDTFSIAHLEIRV